MKARDTKAGQQSRRQMFDESIPAHLQGVKFGFRHIYSAVISHDTRAEGTNEKNGMCALGKLWRRSGIE